MTYPINKSSNNSSVSSVVKGATMVFVVATVVLVAIQSRVSLVYEGVAKQVGVYDQQVHALNAVYLDYEEQSAIMRSSNFLLQEHGGQFASASEKVLYVEPGQAVLSQQ